MDQITLRKQWSDKYIYFTENWCSNGCCTDGLVDALEQAIQMDTKQMDLLRNLDGVSVWMLYRWTCGCTQTLLLFTMDAQQIDMLMHRDFAKLLLLFTMYASADWTCCMHGHY